MHVLFAYLRLFECLERNLVELCFDFVRLNLPEKLELLSKFTWGG